MADILGATTAGIATARQLADMVPASGLSGIKDAISDAYNDTIKAVNDNIGHIFSSTGTGLVDVDYELPMSNVLHEYATYNYIFSLTCLDPDSYNYPGSSYMVGKIPPLILKSGSADPDNRITLDGRKFEFYLDDLTLTHGYGFEKGTGNVNTTNIEFKVTEPYSMGMFMIACQTAAYNQGYKNYNEAPFLLIIEFKGNTEMGLLKHIPNTTKFIPIHFNTIEMTVTEAGSVYNIVGYIANSAALNDSYTQLKSDTTITGRTVQEILQTGPKSLQNVINARYREAVDDKTLSVPDEIVILFPTDTSTDKTGAALSGGKNDTETKSSATIDPTKRVSDPKLFKQLGVSRSATNHTLVQKDGECNALGRASLGFDTTRAGTAPFSNDNDVYDEKSKGNIRANNVAAPGLNDFKFQQGSDIINAINQVMLKSELAVAALKPDQMDEQGMRPWWKVDVQTYTIATDENLKITGTMPKILVYRVIPYKVHSSRMLAPNAPAPKIAELKKQAAKEYNYIYTGKNVDIIKFDITINNTFYQVMMADNGKRSRDVQMAAQTATGATGDKGDIQTPISPSKAYPGAMPTIMKAVGLTTSTDNKGGSRGETTDTRAARLFHDSMLNGMDMMNITFDIVGDPYYIANSGAGNYTATSTNLINVTKDGEINYQNGEVDIVVNFRTPTDIIQVTGMYDMDKTILCQQFSGLYKITTIVSTFRGGQFTQSLTCNRRQGQDSIDEPTAESFLTTTKILDPNKGKSIEDTVTKALESVEKTANEILKKTSKWVDTNLGI